MQAGVTCHMSAVRLSVPTRSRMRPHADSMEGAANGTGASQGGSDMQSDDLRVLLTCCAGIRSTRLDLLHDMGSNETFVVKM